MYADQFKSKAMNKRINIILPETTVAILDKVTGKGSRSRLIDQPIKQFVYTQP